MTYATSTDLILTHGQDWLDRVADRDFDGAADETAVMAALDEAAGLIDAYLAPRYALPLAAVPDILRRAAVDLAARLLCTNPSDLVGDIKDRAERADALLRDLAAGRAALPPEAVPGAAPGEPPRPVVMAGPPRLMTRNTLRGV
ncbi:phage protein Gp36 family protein [Roseospira visakhapatnamensis]|uniref:Phage gp36-like protein n=1 Tax=Roseospira visakhapatnamensis TaxID=390880 RepID=A0A7W6REI9_9PROT|nr:phage gp36-like protein [Roseospira visakhapatnamensis]